MNQPHGGQGVSLKGRAIDEHVTNIQDGNRPRVCVHIMVGTPWLLGPDSNLMTMEPTLVKEALHSSSHRRACDCGHARKRPC